MSDCEGRKHVYYTHTCYPSTKQLSSQSSFFQQLFLKKHSSKSNLKKRLKLVLNKLTFVMKEVTTFDLLSIHIWKWDSNSSKFWTRIRFSCLSVNCHENLWSVLDMEFNINSYLHPWDYCINLQVWSLKQNKNFLNIKK